ncbi:hypothetical protein D1914_22100 [Salmonella enterica]|nr:hypothetical protein [Salmonella enterica]EAU3170799.1 hypothetical protein [Salmonella enterica]EAV0891513.1 hypothetical protein [Salmonella enterica]EBL1739456.1 hypothetical protein [Salmonella enterica]SQI66740.1 Uncharacterised protein [Salmonella enterica subsp. diarizonae]
MHILIMVIQLMCIMVIMYLMMTYLVLQRLILQKLRWNIYNSLLNLEGGSKDSGVLWLFFIYGESRNTTVMTCCRETKLYQALTS